MEKAMGKKVKGVREGLIYASSSVIGYLCGTLFSAGQLSVRAFSRSFFYSFGQAVSGNGFFYGFLFFVVPLSLSYLNGFSFAGSILSSAVLFFRSFLSGFATASVGSLLIATKTAVLVLYTLCECFGMLVLVSSACDSSRVFRYFISVGMKRNALITFTKHFFMRLSLLLFLYIVRSVVCIFINT